MGTVRPPCAPPHGSAPSSLSPCTRLGCKAPQNPRLRCSWLVFFWLCSSKHSSTPFSQQQAECRRLKEGRQSLPSPRLVLLKLSPLWGPGTHPGSACAEQEPVAAPSLPAGPVPGCAVPWALPPPGPTSQLGSEPRVAVETGQTAPRGHPNLGQKAAKTAPLKAGQAARGQSSLARLKSPSPWAPHAVLSHTHDKCLFPYVQGELSLLQHVPATSFPCSGHLGAVCAPAGTARAADPYMS